MVGSGFGETMRASRSNAGKKREVAETRLSFESAQPTEGMVPRLKNRMLILVVIALTLLMLTQMFKPNNVQRSCANLSRPLIFVGGVPRSGTTLMRALLDVHSMVRCGEETIVVPKLLGILQYSHRLAQRYEAAKISKSLLEETIGTAILGIIEGHGSPASILCNKDPLTMKNAVLLGKIFPNSKFIFMIRDGRAVVYSLIKRGITVTGFNLSDWGQCLSRWSSLIFDMSTECTKLGTSRCLPVYFEQLVLHPKAELEKILKFLDLNWEDRLLNHHHEVGNEISISRLEWSNDQIAKPINTGPLTEWVKHFPEYLKPKAAIIAPSLALFGYDPAAFPPDYGTPDDIVFNNTKQLEAHRDYWEQKVKHFRRK